MKTILILLFALSAQAYEAKYIPAQGFDKMSEEEQKEFDVEIDRIIEQVCGLDARLVIANNIIARENEVSKLTGTKNLSRLNQAGGAVVDVTRERNKYLKVYKDVMGKDLKDYECQ